MSDWSEGDYSGDGYTPYSESGGYTGGITENEYLTGTGGDGTVYGTDPSVYTSSLPGSNWFEDLAKGLGFKTGSQLAALAGALGGGLSSLMNLSGSGQKVGYTGGIPKYSVERGQIAQPLGSTRRPGEYGRSYFTDPQYKLLGLMETSTDPNNVTATNVPVGPVSTQNSTVPATSATSATSTSATPATETPVTYTGPTDTIGYQPVKAASAYEVDKSIPQVGHDTRYRTFRPDDMTMPVFSQEPVSRNTIANRQQLYQTMNQLYGTPIPAQYSGAAPVQQGVKPQNMAQGGIAALSRGRYLDGATDGMADQLPANIDGKQQARLSHGEFVVPADVVSHLGNGNSTAGAQRLYDMMDRIRKARTGTKQQGKQINPDKFLPR